MHLHTHASEQVSLRIVGSTAAASQNDVAVLVPTCPHDRGHALRIDTEEIVRMASGLNGVNGHADRAVGTVLEADRETGAGCEFTVELGLGGTCADGAPSDEVGNELRTIYQLRPVTCCPLELHVCTPREGLDIPDSIQQFPTDRHPHLVDITHQLPRHPQTLIDLKAPVNFRIIDQPLPPDGRTGLFEVHPHHNFQPLPTAFLHACPEPPGVFFRLVDIVDRARADDDE